MDKWDQMMQDFYLAISERSDEKLIRTVVGFVLELARTVERIADALEKK